MASLDAGLGRDVFLKWASVQGNVVILPDRGPPQSLARKLYQEWEHITQESNQMHNLNFDLSLMVCSSIDYFRISLPKLTGSLLS
jgi:hypothetical protein